MPHIELPMNTAHQHAANAEDYLSSGLLIPAAEEHLKAAEAYMAAVDRSGDESTKRTLRMLYNEHCKAAKELERKIAKLRSEGKDPSIPQKLDSPAANFSPATSSYPVAGPSRTSVSPLPQGPLADSQGTVDESFMLLGGQRSDPGDAFNQFWNIMQGMLDNLSQPVAFATVPLGAEATSGTSTPPKALYRDASLSSDTDIEEPTVSRWTRKLGMARGLRHSSPSNIDRNRPSSAPSNSSQSSSIPDVDIDDGIFEEGDDLSGSFFVIPSESTMTVLHKENMTLKKEVETLQKRLDATERVLQMRKEQDMQLRDSIVQASKEAQRAMGASLLVQRGAPAPDLGALNVNVPVSALPIPGIHTAREGQYMRRVKELEDELRSMRIENDKNKAMIAKFRERWEKLKESAKKKKESKAAAEAAKAVQERIVEEPEVEAELDSAQSRS